MPKYVVMTDLVTVGLGTRGRTGAQQARRLRKGQFFEASKDHKVVQNLLASGVIERAKSPEHMRELQGQRRLTVRQIAKRSGAPDDPVKAPKQDVLPIDAPLPETNPDAIFADSPEEIAEREAQREPEGVEV